MTTLIISYAEIKDIMNMVRFIGQFGLLIESVSETIENEAKKTKSGFLDKLLGTLGAILSGNLLTGTGVIQAGKDF